MKIRKIPSCLYIWIVLPSYDVAGLNAPETKLLRREIVDPLDADDTGEGEWVVPEDLIYTGRLPDILDAYGLQGFGLRDEITSAITVQRSNADSDKCLLMYHVAKSGGGSLRAWAEEKGLKLYKPYGQIDEGKVQVNEKADVYMGHWGLGVEDFFAKHGMSRNCMQFTILRNPLERVASGLFYLMPGKSFDDYTDLLGQISRGKKDSTTSAEHSNMICRQFSKLTSTWDRYDPIYNENWNSTCDVKRAKENLQSLNGVGFLENFDKELNRLANMLGLPNGPQQVPKIEHRSKNPGFNHFPSEAQQLIRQLNVADVEIYAWAVRTFKGASFF